MRKLIGTAAAFALTLVACTRSEPARPSAAEDVAAIARFNERYLEAINNEDITALSELTTESHILTPPSGKPIEGKAANDAVNGRSFAQVQVQERWTPLETQVSGDLGFQRGTYDLVTTPKAGGEPTRITGYFQRIYQRQPNGEWRMTRDMFNIDRSTQNSAAPQ
jgi:ketosteroid isomerase-like protein